MPYDKITPLLPGEEFRPHPRFPIDVSDQGRARSQKSGKFVGHFKGTRPTPSRSSPSLPGVRLGGTRSGWRVEMSEAVLETFVGPRPHGHEADHINHDRLNNRLDNLRWRPQAENRADHG